MKEINGSANYYERLFLLFVAPRDHLKDIDGWIKEPTNKI
jgi:hypothetical protein